MRRRPYSELLEYAGVKPEALPPRPDFSSAPQAASGPDISNPEVPSPAPDQEPIKTLDPESVRRYREEIRNLADIVSNHQLSADAEGKEMCAYVSGKLSSAADALKRADEEACWVELFGAATLCYNSSISTQKVAPALHRINALLG